jgi:hypothetical protein
MSILNNQEKFTLGRDYVSLEKCSAPNFDSHYTDKNKSSYKNDELIIFFVGKIYNTENLIRLLNIKDEYIDTHDIIALIYALYGFDYMMKIVDGVFSLIILDQNVNNSQSTLHIIRDEFGIFPLYTMTCNCKMERNYKNNIQGFSTDYNGLLQLSNALNKKNSLIYEVIKVEPGCHYKYNRSNKVSSVWEFETKTLRTVNNNCCNFLTFYSRENIIEQFYQHLMDAALKRIVSMNHFDIVCCVDSDNLESIMLVSIVKRLLLTHEFHKLHIFFTNQDENTFSSIKEHNQENVEKHLLPNNSYLAEFIKSKMNGKDFTLFSSVSFFVKKSQLVYKSLMDIDNELFNYIPSIQYELISDNNEYENVEYPFLDTNLVKNYLSVEITYRDDLLLDTLEINFPNYYFM